MSNASFLSANGNSKATTLNARASDNFAAKLAETQALLQRAAAEFSPVTQASSLGAEDVVITHLINSWQLDIPVFVLDTGALHTGTLALLASFVLFGIGAWFAWHRRQPGEPSARSVPAPID